jgi:hypothetical protein
MEIAPQSNPNKTIRIDGKLYISKADKHGNYFWQVLKEMEDTKNPEEYYSQFPDYEPQKYNVADAITSLRTIAPKLKKLKIHIISTGWISIWSLTGFHSDKVDELLHSKKLGLDTPTISYSAFRKYWAGVDGQFYLNHTLFKTNRAEIIDIFKAEFGKRFEWDGKDEHSILIKLKKL